MDRKINNNQDDNQDKAIAAEVGGESSPAFEIMSSNDDYTEELPPMRYVLAGN
jgi:hypothetical protein